MKKESSFRGLALAGIALIVNMASVTALADDEDSYNFVQFRPLEPSINGDFLRAISPGAFAMQGAFSVHGDFQLFAQYLDAGLERSLGLPKREDIDDEESRFSLGLGYSYLLGGTLDVTARAAYEQSTLDLLPPPSLGRDGLSYLRPSDEEGYSLQLGLRGLSWDANVRRLDLGGYDTGYGFGGHLKFKNGIRLGADVQVFEDVTTWTLGGRYFFGD